MQQGSTSALWVQKLNNILRRNCARLWDRDPQKVPRWENNTTWGKDPELNIVVTRRASEQKHHKNLYHSCCFLDILPLQLSETLQCIGGISHTTGSFYGRISNSGEAVPHQQGTSLLQMKCEAEKLCWVFAGSADDQKAARAAAAELKSEQFIKQR